MILNWHFFFKKSLLVWFFSGEGGNLRSIERFGQFLPRSWILIFRRLRERVFITILVLIIEWNRPKHTFNLHILLLLSCNKPSFEWNRRVFNIMLNQIQPSFALYLSEFVIKWFETLKNFFWGLSSLDLIKVRMVVVIVCHFSCSLFN